MQVYTQFQLNARKRQSLRLPFSETVFMKSSLSVFHALYGHPDHACQICCAKNSESCYHNCRSPFIFCSGLTPACSFSILIFLEKSTVFCIWANRLVYTLHSKSRFAFSFCNLSKMADFSFEFCHLKLFIIHFESLAACKSREKCNFLWQLMQSDLQLSAL